MPRFSEGTSTKRRAGPGSATMAAAAAAGSSLPSGAARSHSRGSLLGSRKIMKKASSSSSAAAASRSNGISSARGNNNNNNKNRRLAEDLIDTDTDSEDERSSSISGGNARSPKEDSFAFVAPPSEAVGWQKENVVHQKQPQKQRNIQVLDKTAKDGSSTTTATTKKAAASSTTKTTTTAATGPKKKRPTSRSRATKADDNGGKKKSTTASNSKKAGSSGKRSAAATATSKKRSPTRVRFEQDGADQPQAVSPPPSLSATLTSKSAQPTIPTVPIHPRAVGIDTRILQTFTGDAAGRAFLGQTLSFLKSAARRGVLPEILAVTHANVPKTKQQGGAKGKGRGRGSGSSTKARATIEAKATALPTDKLTGREYVSNDDAIIGSLSSLNNSSLQDQLPPRVQEEQQYWNEMLVPVQIRPPVNVGNVVNRDSVHVPKSLLAHDSWKHFAELVTAVEAQVARGGQGGAGGRSSSRSSSGYAPPPPPRSLTIFTSDVSLFTDTNDDSHKRAVGRFWDKIRGTFERNVVGSVTIAIYETGAVAMRSNAKPLVEEGTEGEGEGEEEQQQQGAAVMDSFPTTHPDDALSHRLKVKKCIGTLCKQIEVLYEKDRRKNAAVMGTPPAPVQLELQVIENPIMYQALLRDWIRDIVSPSSGGGRISFNLPETMDGTQCAISLDLAYSILPYAANSIETAKLLQDFKVLSSAEFEVIQLLPVPSVDGLLLYSVPMSATAAMDSDLFRYKEMKLLVRQLWKYLASNDVALALRCVGTKQQEESTADADTSIGSHANDLEGQCFLLMAEDPTGTMGSPASSSSASGIAPLNGVLYRYASADQVLRDVQEETADALQDESDEETSQQYFEYIDQSLECLDSCPLNPLFVDTRTVVKAKEKPLSGESLSVDDSDTEDATRSMDSASLYEGKWRDGVRVGSGAAASLEDEEMIQSDDMDDEHFHEFDYSF